MPEPAQEPLIVFVDGPSQVAHGVCEVPSMKVLTRGRMNEQSRESADDSELLAS